MAVTLPITAEFVDDDLSHYHDFSKESNLNMAPNGYYYFDIDGLTITFFNLENKLFHVVVCELNQQFLNNMNLSYDEFIALNPLLTFNLDNQ